MGEIEYVMWNKTCSLCDAVTIKWCSCRCVTSWLLHRQCLQWTFLVTTIHFRFELAPIDSIVVRHLPSTLNFIAFEIEWKVTSFLFVPFAGKSRANWKFTATQWINWCSWCNQQHKQIIVQKSHERSWWKLL